MTFETMHTRYGFSHRIDAKALTHQAIVEARQPFYDTVLPTQARLKMTLFALLLTAFILTIPGGAAALILSYDLFMGTSHGDHEAVQAGLMIFLGGIALIAIPVILVRQRRKTLDKQYYALRDFAYLAESLRESSLPTMVYRQLEAMGSDDVLLQRYINDIKEQGRDYCLGEAISLMTHYLHCKGVDTRRYHISPEKQLEALSVELWRYFVQNRAFSENDE